MKTKWHQATPSSTPRLGYPGAGFIGTVLGLSLAIGRFTATLQAAGDLTLIRASLQGVTGGLATAFESTLVALTFTLLLQLAITFQQKREMTFLDECNDYCHSHIVAKLRLAPDNNRFLSHLHPKLNHEQSAQKPRFEDQFLRVR